MVEWVLQPIYEYGSATLGDALSPINLCRAGSKGDHGFLELHGVKFPCAVRFQLGDNVLGVQVYLIDALCSIA